MKDTLRRLQSVRRR